MTTSGRSGIYPTMSRATCDPARGAALTATRGAAWIDRARPAAHARRDYRRWHLSGWHPAHAAVLIPQYRPAVLLALAVIAFELLALAWIRRRFFGTSFLSSLMTVTLGGAIIVTISAALVRQPPFTL
jgi:hypothetical protein